MSLPSPDQSPEQQAQEHQAPEQQAPEQQADEQWAHEQQAHEQQAQGPASDPRSLDRQIWHLALPALGALIAEPAFLIADTAMVGHLGKAQLAGIGLGQTVLQTVTGLLIFLAYGTTPRVARLLGAGRRSESIRVGIDGLWLALVVGLILLAGWPLARPTIDLFGASPEVSALGTTYLQVSMLGLPAMLMVLAATGLVRGLQDTRTPLVVSGGGFVVNIALNAVLIYGLHLGVLGSALGTVISQWGMLVAYLVVIITRSRRIGADVSAGQWVPRPRQIVHAAQVGGWLLVRTASLRAALLATTAAATRNGTSVLAATQILFTLFSTLAFALDALAVAGQSLLGVALGAGDAAGARQITRRLVRWGLICGAVLAVGLCALSPIIGRVFTGAPDVLAILPWAVVALALAQPIAGLAFVLDGVLIGAGDARFLAIGALVCLLVYLPALEVSRLVDGAAALVVIWIAFSFVYLGARAVVLGLRARTDRWLVLGA